MSENVIRPATPADAPAIGEIHSAAMAEQLVASLGSVPDSVTAGLRPDVFAASWEQSIAAPPTPRHRVIVAADGDQVVGFLALSPGTAPLEPSDGEVLALEIGAKHRRAGHASRLLVAAVNALRQDGATAIVAWATNGDEGRIRLLTEAGFGPRGVRRGFEVGTERVMQFAWYASV